jgi:putative endonuclease
MAIILCPHLDASSSNCPVLAQSCIAPTDAFCQHCLRLMAGVVAQLVERLVRNEKVAGSIPVGSTSLRSPLRSELRLGKLAFRGVNITKPRIVKGESERCRAAAQCRLAMASARQFFYVYILQSELSPACFCVGITEDLKARLLKHNAGGVPHTMKGRPWRIKSAIAFTDEKQAHAFERYLKTASGRAFSKKRL